jgi:hypothetical protein
MKAVTALFLSLPAGELAVNKYEGFGHEAGIFNPCV